MLGNIVISVQKIWFTIFFKALLLMSRSDFLLIIFQNLSFTNDWSLKENFTRNSDNQVWCKQNKTFNQCHATQIVIWLEILDFTFPMSDF